MPRKRPLITTFVLAVFSLSLMANAQFKDVPAGHWARQAVEYITQCGLIEGFPDGTFRGNQNLTRYQAALIFFRLLQTNTKCPIGGTQGQQVVNQGIEEVKTELADLTKRFADLEKKYSDQDARLSALEAQVKQISDTSKTLEDVQKRLSDLETTVKNLPQPQAQDNSAILARLDALETQVKNIATGNLAGAYSVQAGTDLEKKVAVLEEQVRQLAARPSPADQSAQIAVLQEQTKTLSDRVNTLQSQLDALKQQGAQPQPQPQPEPQPQPQPVTPVTPPAPAAKNFYIGAGASYAIIPTPAAGQELGVGGFVGLKNLFLGFGLRAGVDYRLGNNNLLLEAYLTRYLSQGGFLSPYLGIGVRSNLSATDPLTNTFGTGLVGADFNLFGPVALFVEATPGLGPNTSFSLGARAGLKFSF